MLTLEDLDLLLCGWSLSSATSERPRDRCRFEEPCSKEGDGDSFLEGLEWLLEDLNTDNSLCNNVRRFDDDGLNNIANEREKAHRAILLPNHLGFTPIVKIQLTRLPFYGTIFSPVNQLIGLIFCR